VNLRIPWIVFLLTLLAAASHIAWSGTVLPERVASHFGPGGGADSWSTPGHFMAIYALTVALMSVVFAGPTFFFPRLPDGAFNLPRREYWLAPERREATLTRFTGQFLLLGAATNAFLVAIMHLVVRANLTAGEPRLSTVFFVIFGTYMFLVLGWTAWILVYYLRAPAANRES